MEQAPCNDAVSNKPCLSLTLSPKKLSALRAEADKLPPGETRDLLLRKARQADTATHVDDWLNSPGLQPPK